MSDLEAQRLADALCREKFKAFAFRAFGIVSPGERLEWNWHLDCLEYSSLVVTPYGCLEIGWLVENGYSGEVLSFNHKINKPEWKKVTARMKKTGETTYTIVSSKGDAVKATANHPFFANGKYVETRELKIGDEILQILPKRIPHYLEWSAILQQAMLWKNTLKTKKYSLPKLWWSKKRQGKNLQKMFWPTLKKRFVNSLQKLRKAGLRKQSYLQSSSKNTWYFLRQSLFCKLYKGAKQSCIYRWRSLKSLLQTRSQSGQKKSHEKRKWFMFFVQNKKPKTARYAPCGQRYIEQRDMEYSYVVPAMPQQPKGKRRNRNFRYSKFFVSSITKNVQIPESVYNLEVEGNNNFFCNGILTHNCIAEHLEASWRGELPRLIINMPPRSLKSFLVSIAFPAWVLGKEPHEKFMVASHTIRPLAAKLSNDSRRLIESDWYKRVFPETKLVKATETELYTGHNGHRLAFGVTGPTGLGCNYFITDDLNKPDEALSDTIRMNINGWVDNTAMSRFNDYRTGRLICVMQRVHENDVTGHLIDKGGYHLLKLPAEFERKPVIQIGGKTFTPDDEHLLFPARLPQAVLDEKRNDLGSYAYAGQFLQEPVPIGGGMFKSTWVKYYNAREYDASGCNVFILVDPANSKKKTSDWTAMSVVALAPDNNYYLLDMVRDKLNPTERINKLFELHRKWNEKTGKPPRVGYEQYGLVSDIHYIQQKQDADSYRFNVVALGGKASKVDRIARMIPDMENGRWYFPTSISYTDSRGLNFDLVDELIKGEMLTFPVSKHDDCLDSLARIYEADLQAAFPKLQARRVSAPAAQDWMDF